MILLFEEVFYNLKNSLHISKRGSHYLSISMVNDDNLPLKFKSEKDRDRAYLILKNDMKAGKEFIDMDQDL